MSEVVSLARDMIRIESITGNEEPMVAFLETWLSQRGWSTRRQNVEPGRDNLYAFLEENPRLILNSHVDTVPPYFAYDEDDEFIHGRGACDTKGIIACQLLAAENLKRAGVRNIGLLYVVGEEVDHIGMQKANELKLNPEFLIVGEPTESQLARRQKGVLRVVIKSRGKAGHSGYPEVGSSAITPLIETLHTLQNYNWPCDVKLGETTLNIGLISGGLAGNIIPPFAEAELVFRLSTPTEDVKRVLEKLIREPLGYQILVESDPYSMGEIEGFPSVIVSFHTDIPYLQFQGTAFLWGPGSILDAHTAHEKIRKQDLLDAVNTYENMVNLLLEKNSH